MYPTSLLRIRVVNLVVAVGPRVRVVSALGPRLGLNV